MIDDVWAGIRQVHYLFEELLLLPQNKNNNSDNTFPLIMS